MLKTKEFSDFGTGEKICLFKKGGVLPIAVTIYAIFRDNKT